MSSANIYDIMRALNNKQIDTTMIYLQKIMDREQHAIHKWSQDTLGRYIIEETRSELRFDLNEGATLEGNKVSLFKED